MIEDAMQQILRGYVFCLGLISDNEAVAENVVPDGLDVVRRDIAPPFQESQTFGGTGQENRRSRAGPILDVGGNVQAIIRRGPRGMNDVNHVSLNLFVHV